MLGLIVCQFGLGVSFCFSLLSEVFSSLVVAGDYCMELMTLESLGSLFQGLLLTRYLSDSPGAISCPVVQVRDLDSLYIGGALESFSLRAPNLKRYCLEPGDVVLSVRGSSQRVSVVDGMSVGAIAGPNLAVFRPSEKLDSLFLAVLLRSDWLSGALSRLYGQSSGTRSVSLTQLRLLEIPVPSLAVQREVGALFLALERFRMATLGTLESRQQLAELSLIKLLGEPL